MIDSVGVSAVAVHNESAGQIVCAVAPTLDVLMRC